MRVLGAAHFHDVAQSLFEAVPFVGLEPANKRMNAFGFLLSRIAKPMTIEAESPNRFEPRPASRNGLDLPQRTETEMRARVLETEGVK